MKLKQARAIIADEPPAHAKGKHAAAPGTTTDADGDA
jgi:hypothetical protein